MRGGLRVEQQVASNAIQRDNHPILWKIVCHVYAICWDDDAHL
jgi:hypothetical protein